MNKVVRKLINLKTLFITLFMSLSFITMSLNKNDKITLLQESKKHLGTKYVYGAKSGNTNSFDCSSFMLYLYRKIDINLPRTSREQAKKGKKVDLNELEIGDLIFFKTNNRIHHVGMYIGENQFVHASSAGKRVMISELKGFYKNHYALAKRYKYDNDIKRLKEKVPFNDIAFYRK